jgi:hypothetical protein
MLKDYKINRGYIRESPFKEIDNLLFARRPTVYLIK